MKSRAFSLTPAFLLVSAILCSFAFGQTEPADEMDESGVLKDFAEAAAKASGEGGGIDSKLKVPVGQRPLETRQSWRRTTGKLFGFSLAGEFVYWIEGKFGKGGNASFHEHVFRLNLGVEADFTFKITPWAHGLVHSDYMYHKGSSGVVNGIYATISSFSTVSFMLGMKLIYPIGDFFDLEEGILADTDIFAKLAGGAIMMTEVVREKPAPATTYWRDGTLWGASLGLGLEFHLDEKFSFFGELSWDLFSNPDPSSALRDDNKSSPFYFYIVQFGWVFYFD
jgi:hypothetical protein